MVANKLKGAVRGIAAAATALVVAAVPAFAETPPALAGVSEAEAARLGKLIDGARSEGSLSYWDGVIQPETNDALTSAFRRHYGLPAQFQVRYQLLATSALVTRVEQEIAAGRVTVDVAAVGYPSWAFERAAAGDVLAYDSPQYAHYAQAIAKGLGRAGLFAFNGAYMFVPMWNADRLAFNGHSLKDVAGAVPAGRLSTGDVGKSVAYLATYAGQRQVLGVDDFKAVAAMRPSFVIRYEQIAARLVAGEDLMTFSGMPTRAYQYNQKGARLRFMLPEEGIVLLPQTMFILARAPHPNAAKLWIDFVLSEQGQTIMVRSEATVSGRGGFPSPLPDYAPPIDSLRIIPVDWQGLSGHRLQALREEWVAAFQP
jgi:iron(III) transport system substrate-binding protein